MASPVQLTRPIHGGNVYSDATKLPSNNVWVGNLSIEVTDSDLTNLFSKYGEVDCVTPYPSRSYAFVCFKRLEDAMAAVQGLCGAMLRGKPIRVDFAKPAKPCKSLWVSGISPSITKETLEEEFLKFGKIEQFKFVRDRNTANVYYFRLEDASQALESMNGKWLGGGQIRVDFLRSKRKHSAEYRDTREEQFLSRSTGLLDSPWMPQDVTGNYSEPSKRQQHSQSYGAQKLDAHPSNILWIGYPPFARVDEKMLHDSMILFGEIESIRSFPSRNYSIVEFKSLDEARRAKEGLQGRLFNDPRVSIMYYGSDHFPSMDYPGFHWGAKWPRPDVFHNEPPFQSGPIDMCNRHLSMISDTPSGRLPSHGITHFVTRMTPFGPQGSVEPILSKPILSAPNFNDLSMLHKVPDADPKSLIGGPNWRRSSPALAMLPSSSVGEKRPIGSGSSAWEEFDVIQREPKRPNIDTVLPVHDSLYPEKRSGDRPLELDQLGHPNHYYVWRGEIAKGGANVCRARCVPVGKGIESEILDLVDCTGKMGLDILAKYCANAVGLEVVFFLPDREKDFAEYTMFLHYLRAKNETGVAKFADGNPLFLVPPSDFLSKVVNVTGPERIYGVALKLPQHASSSTSMQPQSQSHNMDRQQMHSQTECSGMPQKEEKMFHIDCNRVSSEDSLHPTKQLAPSTIESLYVQLAHSINPAAVSQAGVALTPEFMATLPSSLPSSAKASSPESAPPPLVPSSIKPWLHPSAELDRGHPPQCWKHHLEGSEQTAYRLHEMENQLNPKRQLSQLQTSATSLDASINYPLALTGNSEVQDPTFDMPQGAISSRPSSTFGIPSQRGQLVVPLQVDQQHRYEVPQTTQTCFGIARGTDSLGSYGSPVY